MAKTFRCSLITPEKQVLQDEVAYASIPAWDGLIGVAPQRSPLVVQLTDGPLRLDYEEGGSRWFFIGGGFAQIHDDHLVLLANQAVPADEIDSTHSQDLLKNALAQKPTSDEAFAAVARSQLRARVMLQLAGRKSAVPTTEY